MTIIYSDKYFKINIKNPRKYYANACYFEAIQYSSQQRVNRLLIRRSKTRNKNNPIILKEINKNLSFHRAKVRHCINRISQELENLNRVNNS